MGPYDPQVGMGVRFTNPVSGKEVHPYIFCKYL